MPIYEYTCRKCKAHVEILQKMTDKPLVKCKKCGGRLEKEWSRSGVQFKGTGWYVTDYAGKQTDAKGDAAAESKSEAKSEAKPETKTESAPEKSGAAKAETSKPESGPAGGGKKTPKAGTASKGASKE